jgi:signal transduction histidine kinase
LSNNFVRAIHEDQDGALWLGTYGGGLNRMRNGRITHITTKQGLFDDFISRIVPGDDDTFWLLGNRGIFQVSRRALGEVADGQRQSVTCVVYDAADGMNPSEGQGGFQPAGWRARDGRLYFPTIRGVAVVDPSLASRLAPTVIIERVLLDGAELDFRHPIEIPPGKGNLEIHYTGLSLGKPERVQFRFRLSGLNENWEDVGQRRTAYFPQLQPGRYRFSVKAFSPDGVWSEREAELAFVVRPPFWRTAWFLSLVALALSGLAMTGYRWRVAIFRARVAQQETFARELIASQEQERQRIAAELHDGLGQSLVIIKRRALLCLDASENPERMVEQVEEILEASAHAISEVREVIFDLRPQQLDKLGLTGAVSDLLTRAANVNGWRLTKQLDEVDGLFSKEAENSLFRIVQESVNNASKHAAATHVAVFITRQTGWVELAVQDDGRGFAMEAARSGTDRNGFGLRGIAERARFLGGLAMIESAPERGTTVRLRLPLKPIQCGKR